MPVQHPFVIKKRNPWWDLVNPVTTGVVFSAIASLFPRDSTRALVRIADKIPVASLISERVYLAIVGYILGFGLAKGCDWVRLKLLRSLLTYQGWTTMPKSYKTKTWAILLKICKGPEPHSTFQFQPYLPKQPLPTLDQTLDKWLQVSATVVNKDEFELTKEVVEEFRKNQGPLLQRNLEEKSQKEDNYIQKYWLSAVYLSQRAPIAINCNYYTSSTVHKEKTSNPMARAAMQIHLLLKFALLLEEDKLSPIVLQDLVPLCMAGYRYLFNSCRIPGEYIDELVRYPGKQHIIVLRKGQYFKVNLHYTDSNGKLSVATPEEIKMVFENIVKVADQNEWTKLKTYEILGKVNLQMIEYSYAHCVAGLDEKIVPVAALTGQKRNIWAKHRQQLMERNKSVLEDVESSQFILDLNDENPEDFTKLGRIIMCGRGYDRWFDKSFNFIQCNNAHSGFNVEHSGLDAMLVITLLEYKMLFEKYAEDGDVLRDPNNPPRDLPDVERLVWDTTGMEKEIENAYIELRELSDELQMYCLNAKYSKGFMKKQRLSPDGYIQMIIQLAYYKMHNKVVKTYEPSTGRLYLLGRTETINPVTDASIAWLKAMINPQMTWQTKQKLLKRAITLQTQNRLVATVGQGCDRHLFALMCTSMQQGMDMPKIFQDKAWQAPYVLSTSQTPIRIVEYGGDMDYGGTTGCFAPSCHNGYGIAYATFGDNVLNLGITSWKSCDETDVERFGDAIHEAMEDMKQLFCH